MGLFSWLGKIFAGPSPKRPAVPQPSPVQRPGANPPSVPASVSRSISFQRPQTKPPRKLDLDLGQFAPLTGDQIKRQAARQGGSFLRNPWFGRRDLIPSASDERTGLIDRGMVGLGLLTPEQLVEIHQVGE